MRDAVLLELAAEAAGYELRALDDGSIIVNARRWNPLADDGDALRLAADLGVDLHFSERDGHMATSAGTFAFSDFNNDRRAATRRAIVMAAAQIGNKSDAPQPAGD